MGVDFPHPWLPQPIPHRPSAEICQVSLCVAFFWQWKKLLNYSTWVLMNEQTSLRPHVIKQSKGPVLIT